MDDAISNDHALRAVELHNESGGSPILIVCEHASNHIPPEFNDLGLSKSVLSSHIAWDPGAAIVSRYMSRALDARCVLGSISRLVYDCNRPPDAVDAMPEKSEIYRIPGNANLSPGEKIHRVATVYKPFKACLEKVVPQCEALVTVHSFTPVFNEVKREVELGILHDSDSALADAIITLAPKYTDLEIRRNEPYGPQHGVTHTLKLHGIANGIPNVMLEIRNDLISTNEACAGFAEVLSELVLEALEVISLSSSAEEKRA